MYKTNQIVQPFDEYFTRAIVGEPFDLQMGAVVSFERWAENDSQDQNPKVYIQSGEVWLSEVAFQQLQKYPRRWLRQTALVHKSGKHLTKELDLPSKFYLLKHHPQAVYWGLILGTGLGLVMAGVTLLIWSKMG